MPNFCCTRVSCLSSPAEETQRGRKAYRQSRAMRMAVARPRSTPANGDGAGDGARPGAHGVTVVAGLDHPLAAGAADDLADVVRPHHHGADARRAAMAPVRPIARQIVGRIGDAEQFAHIPAAPRRRTPPEAAAIRGAPQPVAAWLAPPALMGRFARIAALGVAPGVTVSPHVVAVFVAMHIMTILVAVMRLVMMISARLRGLSKCTCGHNGHGQGRQLHPIDSYA